MFPEKCWNGEKSALRKPGFFVDASTIRENESTRMGT